MHSSYLVLNARNPERWLQGSKCNGATSSAMDQGNGTGKELPCNVFTITVQTSILNPQWLKKKHEKKRKSKCRHVPLPSHAMFWTAECLNGRSYVNTFILGILTSPWLNKEGYTKVTRGKYFFLDSPSILILLALLYQNVDPVSVGLRQDM